MRDTWSNKRLGDLFAVVNDRLGTADGDAPVLSVTKHYGIVPADSYFHNRVASRDLQNYKVVMPGDFAYSTIHIDEGAIARNTGERGVVSPMYTVMRLIADDVVSAYIEHLLQSKRLIDEYRARAAGSINRRRSLTFAKFGEIEVALPPVAEQRRIANLVDAIERQIELSDAQNQAAERLLTALRASADLADVEPVPLSTFIDRIEGGRSPATLDRAPESDERAVLKVSSIRPGQFIPAESKALPPTAEMPERALVRSGDVLMTRANTAELAGAVCRVESAPENLYLSDKTLRLVLREDKADPRYFVHALAAPSVRRQISLAATGSSGSMKNISQAKINSLLVRIPALSEQRSRAEMLDYALGVVRRGHERSQALRAMRSDLLASLLSGAHHIPSSYDRFLESDDEDPADVPLEPATV